jgi:hypothetical protein
MKIYILAVQNTNSIQDLGVEGDICASEGGRKRILKKNAYKVVVEKPEGKRLLGRLWHRWKNNKMEGKTRIHLAQGTDTWLSVLSIVMDLWVP